MKMINEIELTKQNPLSLNFIIAGQDIFNYTKI